MKRRSPENSIESTIERGRDKIGSVLGVESPKGRVMVTAANWLTLFRLLIVPLFWFIFFSHNLTLEITATFLFIVAALTDLYDGKLARRRGEVTAFGNFMDPLADKLIVLSAFWALLIRENFDGLFTLALVWIGLITFREVGLTVLRIWAISGGSAVVTSIWGKWKTGVQLTTLIFTLLALNLRDLLEAYGNPSPLFEGIGFVILINILFFFSALTSLISGGLYLKTVSVRTSKPA